MAVLTFVSDPLLGGWTSLQQQQTEKQAAGQARRGNPGIRAYNRHAPSAQSFYLLEGGATRVGRRERDGGMVTWVGVTPPPPHHRHHHHHHPEKERSLPKIYSGKSITWLSAQRGKWWWRGMFPSLTHTECSALSHPESWISSFILFSLNTRSILTFSNCYIKIQ